MERRGRNRIQSGCFHVILVANYQNNVFTDDLERIRFLQITNHYLKKFDSRISGIALMHTHVHMQIITNDLSMLMMYIHHSFSIWYNRKNNKKGNIFQKPFSSFLKSDFNSQLNNLIYILQNPYVDGLCSHPRNYKWSSYNSCFGKSYICKYLEIDNSIINIAFKSSIELYQETAIISDEKKKSSINVKWRGILDDEVISFVKMSLNGNPISNLTIEELEEMILTIKKNLPATYRQIASVLHLQEDWVRQTVMCNAGIGYRADL